MDFDAASRIYREILETSEERLLREVELTAVCYAGSRVEWKLTSREGRAGMNAGRTAAHDAFIESCDASSRAMAKRGESNAWRAQLGQGRKQLGDFACYLHCMLGLVAA